MKNYEDIIHLSRPLSQKHPPMPLIDRGAQFAAFAALPGFDEELKRQTEKEHEEDLL